MFSPSLVFIAAMCAAESSSNPYKIHTDSKGHVHYGILMISERVVEDVNEWQRMKDAKKGTHMRRYRHREMLRKEESIEVFKLYLERYCTEEQLGHEPTEFDAAMIWHYGPTGQAAKRESVNAHAYWMMIEMAMDRMGVNAE